MGGNVAISGESVVQGGATLTLDNVSDIRLASDLVVDGELNWKEGAVTGSAKLLVNGNMTLSGKGEKVVADGAVMEFAGKAEVTLGRKAAVRVGVNATVVSRKDAKMQRGKERIGGTVLHEGGNNRTLSG